MSLATVWQRERYLERLRTWRYWLDQLGHFALGALCWFPPILGWVIYREIRQATTGDASGRPSASTGWLDPLTDLAFYVLGSSFALGFAFILTS